MALTYLAKHFSTAEMDKFKAHPHQQHALPVLPAQCHRHTFTFLNIESLAEFSVCSRNSHTMVMEYLPLRYRPMTSISPWEIIFLSRKMHWDASKFCTNLVELRSPPFGSISDQDLVDICPRFPKLEIFDLTCEGGLKEANVTDKGLDVITECCSNVRSVNLSNARNCSAFGFRALGECQNLTSLNVRHCEIPEPCLIALTKCSLTALDIAGFRSQPVSGDTLQTFLRGSLQLTKLCLPQINDATLGLLIEHRPQLTHLTFGTTYQPDLTPDGFKRLNELVNLTHLSFVYLNADDTLLNEAVSNCTKLESLQVGYNSKLTNEGIIQFVKSHPGLKQLTLHSCKKIESESLIVALAAIAPDLKVTINK